MANPNDIAKAEEQLRLGFDALDRGNLTQAKRAYADAEALAGEQLEGLTDAQALHAAALIGAQMGKEPTGEFLERALDAYAKEPTSLRKANATAMYGFMLANEGQHFFAIPVMEDAAEQYRSLGDAAQVANAYFNLGISNGAVGEHAKAVTFFERALSAAQSVPGQSESALAPIYQNLGAAKLNTRDFDGAIAALQRASLLYEAAGSFPQNVADCMFGIGQAYLTNDDPLRSVEWFGRAASTLEKAGATSVQDLESLGTYRHRQATALAKAGKPADAIEPMTAAARAFEQSGDEVPAAHVTGLIGDLHAELGQFDEAASFFERALEKLRAFAEQHPGADGVDEEIEEFSKKLESVRQG